MLNALRSCLTRVLLVVLLIDLAMYATDQLAMPSSLEPAREATPVPPSAASVGVATPQMAVIHDIQAPIDWYVWQGYWNSDGQLEPGASYNCGPAAVAMALRYGSNNALHLTPEQVRDAIPRVRSQQKGTYPADLQVALSYWFIPWREVTSLEGILQAIAQDHIVLTSVDMDKVSPEYLGTSVQVCLPDERCLPISGRYYDYQGRHVVVAKGIVQDSRTGQRYVVVYDPNVWGWNRAYYYLDDQRFPKGLNRLYRYEEFEQAFRSTGFPAIEILATPWQPIAITLPTDAVVQPVDSVPFWCSQVKGDVAEPGWCQEEGG